MAESNSEWDSRRHGFELLVEQAHNAAVADVRQQGPMNGPTYSLRYAEFVQAFCCEHNYQPPAA